MAIDFIPSIHAVDVAAWNSLCPPDYPFIRHEFFAALEDSASTNAHSGWQPNHLLVREAGRVLLAMPLFIKHHSYGEYVFDWSWADAYQRHGYNYYPKLVNAIPFTPCYGPRWLLAEDQSLDRWLSQILAALQSESARLGASGWHCLFPEAELSARLAAADTSPRLGCQFHWFNRGYQNFDDFLATMTARKRKNISKERRQVAAQGFTFSTKTGAKITAADWDFFYHLYRDTYAKRSGHAGYLTPDFFHRLGRALPENTLLIVAERAGTPLAAALYLRDATTLYGRYWGCIEEFDFLHFETCYYQGIDYAIANGLQRFDGGAQGEHKLQRGFEPVTTWSNHWLANPAFKTAVDHFLREEAQDMRAYSAAARLSLPFKASA